jgi:hypothetical protein
MIGITQQFEVVHKLRKIHGLPNRTEVSWIHSSWISQQRLLGMASQATVMVNHTAQVFVKAQRR